MLWFKILLTCFMAIHTITCCFIFLVAYNTRAERRMLMWDVIAIAVHLLFTIGIWVWL